MSEERAVRGTRIALTPLSERASAHRTPDERFFVRFPALYRRQAAAFWRATQRSRFRRAILTYSIQRGYAALNRRDYEVTLMRSDPEVEYRPPRDLMPPDIEAVFYGHEGYRKLWDRWLDAFGDLRWEPEELLDLGDRVLVTVQLRGHGSGSGVPIDETLFQLCGVRRGLVIWQKDFSNRSEALQRLGLSE
jgi:ketosteroid isomerase-like protein